jgi:nucleoside-diphosphate-sugar epimerase
LAEEAAAHAATAGVSFAWARLFQMFGLYEYPQRLVPQVARALIAGRDVACTSGHQIRDYCDTRDVAAALAALLDAEAVTGAVNVASGEAITVREICATIADLAGRSRKLLRFGALPDRAGEPKSLVADVTRLRTEVGFRPTVLTEDRLADTVARYVRAGSAQPQFD